MRKFGLIGFPLTHSFSKRYFEEKFQHEKITGCSYDLFELKSIEEFPPLLRSDVELSGLNVTIPYKESVMQYLDSVSDEAKEISAVNCIRISDGKTIGWNTDVFGFRNSLQQFLGTLMPQQIFVLGTGGSSKAVCYALKAMQLDFVRVSRNRKEDFISYPEIESLMKQRNLFINTTPLGMFPEVNLAPDIPYGLLTANDFLFDLIYNPAETLFLRRGRKAGSRTKNGAEMLVLQAEKSWEIWNS